MQQALAHEMVQENYGQSKLRRVIAGVWLNVSADAVILRLQPPVHFIM